MGNPLSAFTDRRTSSDWNSSRHQDCTYTQVYILSRATFPGAPSYGGVRTWVEGFQALEDRTLILTSKKYL